MDRLGALADYVIRRALGFAGLAAATLMLSLSYDLVLALRMGAWVAAATLLGLLIQAHRMPRRNMRHSELWALAVDHGVADRLPDQGRGAMMAAVMRDRLLWHAERVAALALALWLLDGLALAVSAPR
ncbi:hypothetical protein [Falsiroseomonas stagni]|uniref:Uncharacterized protein n=1 Tax=Falsiroseomonas stagni DSM 19981 TaxID=1123062 RepID=A0A1I3YDD9_9PROT|nr:hypothetical protein [Falsiroseomonas stagni]SFK29888.1 hypothetical protein SAMN02745775_1011197 [Falsiroseomonas stagni DSM 19981]